MIQAQRQWPRVLPLLSAVLIWCGFPGGGEFWPVLTFSLVPLLISLPNLSGKQVLITGFATGVVLYLLLLYWIVFVLGKYGGLPILIAVPATLLLASYMAVYLSFFSFCARLLFTAKHILVPLVGLPAVWVGIDWLRGVLFTGFPWMDLGYALAGTPRLVQLADLFGHHGLTFLILLVNSFFALLILSRFRGKTFFMLAIPVCMLLVTAAVYSESRWNAVVERLKADSTESIIMGVVQGNIDQSLKWSPENQSHTVSTYITSSQSLFGEKRPDLLVWPETALPLYLQTYRGVGGLQGLVAQYDTALLTGAPWFEIVDRATRDVRYFNSAQLLRTDGSYGGSYYKSHLVPFGEYVPMKRFLPFLAPLVEAVGDFSPGNVAAPLDWRGARIGVLICFESIFSDIARKWVKNGANVLVNLTNDAWYGKSSAPYQSMAMSVYRAVETRRSVVRSANTGISGFIDPLGRVNEPSEIFTQWAKAEKVALFTGETGFVRWGYGFAPLCFVVGILLSFITWKRVKREARTN